MKTLKTVIVFVIAMTCTMQASASWVQKADFGSHARHRGTAFSAGNRGFMGLGHYNGAGPNIVLKDWWEYNPATNAWTQKADYIGNNGNGNYGVLSFSTDKYGYIAGGQQGNDNTIYRYDPVLNLWTALSNTPTVPMNTEGFVIGDKGYYVHGNELYEYDFTNDSWTQKNDAPFTWWSWSSAFAINEKGYVKVGSSFWEYKPSVDSWIIRAGFPGLSTAGSIAVVHNEKGYIIAGYSGGLSNVNSEVYEYNPYTNEWTYMEEFPGTSRRFASSFTIGERAYLGIGTNGTNFNDFWEYVPYASVEELQPLAQFEVYPNPVKEGFKISGTIDEFDLTIFNSKGESLIKTSTQTGKIHLQNHQLPSGVYFYQVSIEGKLVQSDKLIVL